MIVDAGTVGMVWKPAQPQQQPTQQEEQHAKDEK